MTTVIDESFNQRCTVSDDKYGYEPAVPKGDADDPYGYGPAAPSVSRHSDDDDAAKYGYGDDDNNNNNNTANLYGYGDTSDSAPLVNRSSTHSTGSESVDYGYGDDEADVRRRRERPRRRGSVTKYSLEATQEVQQEFQNTLQPEASADEVGTIPLKDCDTRTPSKSRKGSDANNSYMSEDDDVSVDDMSCEGQDQDGTDKKKKKKRFGRFRIGRNKSGMSTGSSSSNKARN